MGEGFREGASLLLVMRMLGIVDGVVQTTTLLALQCLTGDEIAHIYHVTQFANVFCRLHTLEEFFCLLVQQVEARCRRRSERTIPT